MQSEDRRNMENQESSSRKEDSIQGPKFQPLIPQKLLKRSGVAMQDNHDVNYSLICAVRAGELERARELISSFGLSYSKAWSEGYVLLHDALKNKHISIAKLLLNYGCKVNSRNIMPSDTPLHLAAASSDTEVVEMILDKGARVNAENKLGETPLHCSMKNSNKNFEITKLLLKHGSNVNVRTKDGESPLHLAAMFGYSQIVEYLLMHGADVNVIKNNGEIPLHLATSRGCSQTVGYLLKYGAYVNCVYTSRWRNGYTPLHCAAEGGSTEVVKLILDQGANVDIREEDSNTALHIAVVNEKQTVVQLLLQYGAKVDNHDKNGKTALHLAVERRSLMTIDVILKHCPDINDQSNRDSLKIAVYNLKMYQNKWCKQVVEALLEYGLKVNSDDENNTNLLHIAVEKGYFKIVEILLKYGADVNSLLVGKGHTKGLTPLHTAVKNKQEEVANLLISNEADINAQDENGKTPIFYATENADLNITKLLLANKANIKDSPEVLVNAVKMECTEIVEVLLRYDADVNAADTYGRTALHFTALKPSIGFPAVRVCSPYYYSGLGSKVKSYSGRNPEVKAAIVRLLLNRGADVDAQTIKGETALYFAIQNEYVKVVETILEYNANVNIGTKKGVMPLCLATLKGNAEICTMLLNKGAIVNVKENGEISSLHIAAHHHHRSIIKLLLKYGARVNCRDKDGKTPLHFACYGVFTILNNHRDIVKLLLKYGAKVTCRDVCVCVKDPYVKELLSMKKEKIVNSNILFYDILVNGASSLAAYMRNENVIEVLKAANYGKQFPLYACILKRHFKKAMERNELLEPANRCFNSLFNGHTKLPFECAEKILSYISNKDLINLIDAFEPYCVS